MNLAAQSLHSEAGTSTAANRQETRSIELPTGHMQLVAETSTFALDDLIGFAARANPKRGFLFMSKVLGKHWPVTPTTMLAIHTDLAERIPADLPEPVVFIAMAETAIGLGQGVFEAYKTAKPDSAALFLHSSRYHVANAPLIEFAEAHSHAPQQFLHMPVDESFREIFASARSLVLVDDEASTGNTFVNLTNVCRNLSPALEHLHLAVITNFMGNSTNGELSARFGINTTMGASLSGRYEFTPNDYQHPPATAQLFAAHTERGASDKFGRMGLNRKLPIPMALAERLAANIRPNESVLVLGTGEFMHMAFLLGRGLETCGIKVMVQSTTRSPILPWGAVSHTLSFSDNYGEGVANFLYNVTPGQYDHVFICHETPVNETPVNKTPINETPVNKSSTTDALHQIAKALGGAHLLHFLSETCIEDVFVC
jgi:hypothetical protein